MPAAQKSERSLRARVEIAQAHADPDIRALAEHAVQVSEELEEVRQRLGALVAEQEKQQHERIAPLVRDTRRLDAEVQRMQDRLTGDGT